MNKSGTEAKRKEVRRDEKANANWGVMEEIPAIWQGGK